MILITLISSLLIMRVCLFTLLDICSVFVSTDEREELKA